MEAEPPLRAGSRVAFIARFLGRRLAYTYEVVEFSPGAKLVMRTADGPFPMETTYTWRSRSDGVTDMRLRNRGSPAGFGRLVAPFLALAMRRANRSDLARLKTLLEACDTTDVKPVGSRLTAPFLGLVLVQAAHSIEEYSTRLYDVLPPARYVSGLLCTDPRIGFAIFNGALVAFGLWCALSPVRRGRRAAQSLAWFWVVLETGNGLAHIGWAVAAGGYRPGLATAPLLAAFALFLGRQLRRASPSFAAGRFASDRNL